MAASHLAGKQAAHGAVTVLHLDTEFHRLAVLERRLRQLDQGVIEVGVEHRVLVAHTPARYARRSVGRGEEVRQVDALCLPVVDGLVGFEQVGAADEVV